MTWNASHIGNTILLFLHHGSHRTSVHLAKVLRYTSAPLIFEDILHRRPAEVVDIALSNLQPETGIKLIEWRALLRKRMNVPVCVNVYLWYISLIFLIFLPLTSIFLLDQDFSYLVRDDIGYAVRYWTADNPSHETLLDCFKLWKFRAKGNYHRITRATSVTCVQHLKLYPLSFSALSLRDICIFLRMMLQYPRFCCTMYTLQSDLSELINWVPRLEGS